MPPPKLGHGTPMWNYSVFKLINLEYFIDTTILQNTLKIIPVRNRISKLFRCIQNRRTIRLV